MRPHLLGLLLALGVCAPAAAANPAASKLPIGPVDTTQTGATSPGDPFRYVAFPAGRGTVLAKIRRADGATIRHRVLKGRVAVAAVAQDASTTGLSADGKTLVLAAPRPGFPQRTSRLTVVDTATLRPRSELVMRGDFGLDGVSPDGRWAYLIQYRAGDPTDYAVRAYDLRRGRLAPEPIVDARNPDEKMTGFSYTRATSADGRWEYTLYGGGSETFVHALDTAGRRAFCVDLHGLDPATLSDLRLAVRHGRVDVVDGAGAAVRHIDATTFRVSEPRAGAAPAARPAASAPPGDGGFPWVLAAVTAAVAAGLAALARRRYRGGTASGRKRSTSSSSATLP
jgi:hypothetical protein